MTDPIDIKKLRKWSERGEPADPDHVLRLLSALEAAREGLADLYLSCACEHDGDMANNTLARVDAILAGEHRPAP